MKKVLFVITKSNWGGAQRYVFDLATTLPREEFEVSVAFGGTGQRGAESGELEKRLKARGIPTMFVRSFARDMFLTSDIRAFFELHKLFRAARPDVVHLNSSKAGGVGALAARFAGVGRIVFTSHGLAFDEDRGAFARRAIWFATWLTFLLSHRVIVISKNNLERARALPFCKRRVHLIYNGIPPLQFEAREKARLSLAVRIGLTDDPDGLWVGTIAELTRNKGLTYLIEAAALLTAARKKFQLFIIGGGEDKEKLQNLIYKHDLQTQVYLAGFTPDAHRFLKAFDIFTLTSVKEGLPYVLLEAGQAGCAALGSNISGVEDIIANSETGLLTEPKNAQDIADKLSELIDNSERRHTLAASLHEKVLREFSAEHMAEATSALY